MFVEFPPSGADFERAFEGISNEMFVAGEV
jgi:hypothetical protein